MKLRVSDDGQKLIVKKFVNQHNHECSRAVYERMASRQGLDKLGERQKAAEMLSVGANCKMVRNVFEEKTGKMKGILRSNIARESKYRPQCSKSELEEIATFLRSQGLSTEYIVDAGEGCACTETGGYVHARQ